MIEILFQNENFVVCHKPAGVLSVPSRDRHDPRPCLGIDLQHQLRTQVLPVHRLDLEVSGLILFALSAKSHKIAQGWFEKKTISKMYRASTSLQNFSHWPLDIKTDRSVLEISSGKEFYWKTRIQRGKRRSFESDHGEWAETRARVMEIDAYKIGWQMFPLTGKPHQLRLELSRRGFPIQGDTLYGSKEKNPWGTGIALQAISLDLSYVSDRLGLPEKISLK
ncbi:MAG: hypothetical protein A2622_11500 [Bdellovibrionales bacterium RIFCSPHIGHO2_01_FULL_40_29]|nr:MAG: hypothetical protein A2622_11500 [Bdellovibrionales bacterium RIFCSPHIGHO2_01_FULL_40_29]OFZ34572.1 MAG: hypothetical protein A3D17_01765 [Bdellovibrionales bacterium RIFCSPHIGHO2_02_FULL_40_15]